MKQFQYNKVLIAFIFVGLVAALLIDVARWRAEEVNKQVDLAIDYEDLVQLAEQEGKPVPEVLQAAKEAGITSLAVYETTFKKLNANGKVTALAGSELVANYHAGILTDPAWRTLIENGTIKGSDVCVVGHDARTYKEVKEDLLRRLGAARVNAVTVNGVEILVVKANYETFLKMDLGMPTDEMQAVNDAGFFVLARPTNYLGCTPDDVDAVFRRLEDYRISEVVFSGSQMLGAPKSLQATIDHFKERNLVLGLIEDTTQLQFYKQDGLSEISKGVGYDHVARLYTIPKDEQPKLKIETAVERWANTDMERNIRINLLRIYEKPAPGMTLFETNMHYIKATAEAVESHGFTLGPAGTFENWYAPRPLRAVLMLGVAAAVVLYLSLITHRLQPRTLYALFALLAFVFAAPILMGSGAKMRILAAFLSANLFPALAVIWQLDRIRGMEPDAKAPLWRIIGTAAVALFVTGALSYVGAAYLSGALADVEYFLEFNIFRGIKLTFVLPIVLVAIAFLTRYDVFDGRMAEGQGALTQLRQILDMPVKLKSLLIFVLVALAAVVFVARSGHTSGMPVSGLELKFRAILEQAFYARPRSKELMIGHPAFMLAVLAWCRKWPTMLLFALVLVATIGQGSMVETFAHMRTPVYMSFVRGIGGIVLGCGIGAALMVLVHLAQMILSSAKERFSKE